MKLKTIYRGSETVLSFFIFYRILLSLFFVLYILFTNTLSTLAWIQICLDTAAARTFEDHIQFAAELGIFQLVG